MNGAATSTGPCVVTLEAARGMTPDLIGGKGASLVRLLELGLPVPPAVIVTTAASRTLDTTGQFSDELWKSLLDGIATLERQTGRTFGAPDLPLLLSVRSGAPVSMPGMMETFLNIGLSESTIAALGEEYQDDSAVAGAYERLAASFAGVVPAGLVPADPLEQLRRAVEAAIGSWSSPRAARYRRFRGIDPDLGTAVVVQAMVLGNLSGESGTGVAFSRDPGTGEPGLYGDFLSGAQGEDVVGGEMDVAELEEIRRLMPGAYTELAAAAESLEADLTDLADIEFTIERGKLWILQVRPGMRTPQAAVRIALDLVDSGVIEWDEALRRIPPEAMVRILDPVLDPSAPRDLLAAGVAVSPGTAVGTATFSSAGAEEVVAAGGSAILFRPATAPADIAGMVAAAGIVTAAGGRASHAAVVARGISTPAICGVDGLEFSEGAATIGKHRIEAGDPVSIDGFRGELYAGELPLVEPTPDPRVERLLDRCDSARVVPLVSRAPAEWADEVLSEDVAEVHAADQLERARGAPELLVTPAGSDGAAALIGAAVSRPGPGRLLFGVPDQWPPALAAVPPGPWAAVVANEQGRLAGRLLAAVIEADA